MLIQGKFDYVYIYHSTSNYGETKFCSVLVWGTGKQAFYFPVMQTFELRMWKKKRLIFLMNQVPNAAAPFIFFFLFNSPVCYLIMPCVFHLFCLLAKI